MIDLENTPIQMGGIIMLMVRPEVSMERGKPGPVTNMEFLPKLYEQYWRLHDEILKGKVPWRVYTCIDAEKSKDEVYERFRYAMDTVLNIHSTYLAAMARAFPEEFDRVRASYGNRLPEKSEARKALEKKLGKRVLIVGGDEMESEDDILQRSFIEGMDLR